MLVVPRGHQGLQVDAQRLRHPSFQIRCIGPEAPSVVLSINDHRRKYTIESAGNIKTYVSQEVVNTIQRYLGYM